MEERWPELIPYGDNRKILLEIKKFAPYEHDNIENFIIENQDKGLTHLVIYQKNNSKYLDEIFYNEKNFPYLEKIFESKTSHDENRMKIFYINYEKFGRL